MVFITTSSGAVLLMLIPWVSAQASQSAPDDSPQLRFVAQLSVSGCALFVYSHGLLNLAVEPVMCVTESLDKLAPRYDPVTQQTYVSVPVTLRDDVMLAEVQRQLRSKSILPVELATVSDISVSTDASSVFEALGFIWSPEQSVGFLQLGCRLPEKSCNISNLVSRLRNLQFEVLDQVMLSVSMPSGRTVSQFKRRLMVQNRAIFDADAHFRRFSLSKCELQFVRSIRFGNCTVGVYEKKFGIIVNLARIFSDEVDAKMRGNFLIEPLLCHNITTMRNESVMYDYSRDMHYLKLDVVLQDDTSMDAVRAQLADLSPRSVNFMPLWRAQSHVASALSRRFVIGPLMMSGDLTSALLRVYCRTENECQRLRSAVIAKPADLWMHVRFSVTSRVCDCLAKSEYPRHPLSMQESGKSLLDGASESSRPIGHATAPGINRPTPTVITGIKPAPSVMAMERHEIESEKTISHGKEGHLLLMRDDRRFLVIRQRVTYTLNLSRTLAEYVRGFGDKTDFWIGLSTIHSLSKNGVTLRVEMKLWDGTELHVEYAGFKVGDASTNYTMTYREMLRENSSVSFQAILPSGEWQFSTTDTANAASSWDGLYCSDKCGQSGWLFSNCTLTNPNGPSVQSGDGPFNSCYWYTGLHFEALHEVRQMLQI